MEDHYIGTDFQGAVEIKNTCEQDRTMTLNWNIVVVRYDGVQIKELKKEKSRIKVMENKST